MPPPKKNLTIDLIQTEKMLTCRCGNMKHGNTATDFRTGDHEYL